MMENIGFAYVFLYLTELFGNSRFVFKVVRNRHWSKVTRELNLPASITSAAFTLRTQ